MNQKKLYVFLFAAMAMLFIAVPVFAQVDANTVVTQTKSSLVTLGKNIINLLSVIAFIVAAVMLIPNGYKYFKGDPNTNDSLMKVGAGILLIVVLLQLIGYFIK